MTKKTSAEALAIWKRRVLLGWFERQDQLCHALGISI
jgi:hypothetical protein